MTRAPLSRYPGMNRFVVDWLAGEAKATRFLPRHSAPLARTARPASLAAALEESNKRWGIFARQPLERWQRGETVTLVAGQQVGFAGGPLYTLAKLATLVRMKRDLEAQGTPATAFFWLATEDHDYEEVAQLNVPVATLGRDKDVNRQLDLVCMRAVRGAADSRDAVGPLPVPESLVTQLLALYDIPRPSWLRPGITFRDSFAELIATVAGSDVILVDALLPELRRVGASLFGQIHVREPEIQRVLAKRGEELAEGGYEEQVIPRDGDDYTLLFELVDGARQPFTRVVEPERISTSALTRPLLQDFVLRPDVFVGGPAEVAYYAQVGTLHDLLGLAMPRVALRGHVLVAPKRVARTLERHQIGAAEVFTSPEALLAAREPEGVARIAALENEARRELLARIEQIAEIALPADHSLARAFAKSVGHIEYHFGKLRERAVKGLVRKDRERHAAAREAVATLFPDRHVQDRVVSWFAYWCLYGPTLFERIVEEVEPDSDHFRIIDL